jgi:hypothetical protein
MYEEVREESIEYNQSKVGGSDDCGDDSFPHVPGVFKGRITNQNECREIKDLARRRRQFDGGPV